MNREIGEKLIQLMTEMRATAPTHAEKFAGKMTMAKYETTTVEQLDAGIAMVQEQLAKSDE